MGKQALLGRPGTLATSDWEAGICSTSSNNRTNPPANTNAKICHTSKRPLKSSANIPRLSRLIPNITVATSWWRGTRSAMAPENMARKLRAIRAEAIKPTRNGESVLLRTNHPRATASICMPVPDRAMEDHNRPKLRWRNIPRGWAACCSVVASFN